MTCKISFPNSQFSPIFLEPHQPLAEFLTIENSPVLFGCRTGLCGTCLVEVIGEISPPNPEEQEVLEIFSSHHPNVRLACQIDLTQDILIKAYAV